MGLRMPPNKSSRNNLSHREARTQALRLPNSLYPQRKTAGLCLYSVDLDASTMPTDLPASAWFTSWTAARGFLRPVSHAL